MKPEGCPIGTVMVEEKCVRYIKDRWLNQPWEHIAIRHKGKWLFYQRIK